jgi:hypothetical protein
MEVELIDEDVYYQLNLPESQILNGLERRGMTGIRAAQVSPAG